MMNGRTVMLALLAGAGLLLSSCVSMREREMREFDRASLPGMIYDLDEKPCAGALVVVDGEPGPRTDLNGRFTIGAMSRGVHDLRVVKDGYEPLETSIDYLDRTQVLYLKVTSHGQLLRMAEEALGRRRLQEADGYLRRAEALDADDPVGFYLRAMYQVRAGDIEGAVQTLGRILASGLEEPAVYLSLADIYQYRVGDRDRAAGYLREYLARVNSPDVRARLEGLGQMKLAGAQPGAVCFTACSRPCGDAAC